MADDILILPNDPDPNHRYIFRTAEYGAWLKYWWQDNAGNYYAYTNASVGHPDYDPAGGTPLLDPDQPFVHESPQFFSPEGLKRNMAAPDGVNVLPNPQYNPMELKNSWHEYYMSDMGDLRYLYLDADVKENIDLYVQHQIRVVDAGLTKFRKFAAELFQKDSERDKAIGCMLLLVDQGWFQISDLINATVADIDFIDETVYLLGRKIKVDVPMFDYLTSLVPSRSLDAPLFSQNTIHGTEMAFGPRTICSVFAYLRVSPVFLQYWHATHLYSKIVNKQHMLQVPAEDAEALAMIELANTLNASSDISFLVDSQVRETLARNYSDQTPEMAKSFTISASDSFGVAQVYSDLVERRGDELQFSQWLHTQPLHTEFEGDGQEDQEDLVAAAQEAQEDSEAQKLLDQEENGDGDGFGDQDENQPGDGNGAGDAAQNGDVPIDTP